MAYRNKSGRSPGRKVRLSQVLPIWTTTNTEVNNAMVTSCMLGMGISDIPSYWRKLRAAIVFCMFLGACIGLSSSGAKGLIVGILLGFSTPAVVIFMTVTLLHYLIFLFAYCLAWAAILCVGWWLFFGH